MTYLDAAYTILKPGPAAALRKDHPPRRAQKLISPQCLTPKAAMESRTHRNSPKEGAHFRHTGEGLFERAKRTVILSAIAATIPCH